MGHSAGRVVAEFQSGAANQVINHSERKGPSKNRLMRSRVNQVQPRLCTSPPCVSPNSEILQGPGGVGPSPHRGPLIAVERGAQRLSLNGATLTTVCRNDAVYLSDAN